MNPDLPLPDGDPGLDQLFRTLTSGPTRAELAGQDAALAMFRANTVRTDARSAPAAVPEVPRRRFRLPFRPGLGLAAATAVMLASGVTAAAYADALPPPVQHIVHDVFKFAGVPDRGHHRSVTTSSREGQRRGGGGHRGQSGGAPSQPPAGKSGPTTGHKPGGSPTASHSPTAPPSPSATVTGPATLTVSAASAQIPADTQVVISGQLTRSGSGVSGVTVKLHEHLAGQPGWFVAGTGQTNADGNVAVTVSALITNAAFRLSAGGGVHSLPERVVVIPEVTITLNAGPRKLRDLLKVSTLYARPGNWVQLQVDKAGVWTALREKRLTAAGLTHFYLSGTNLNGDLVRVKLLATLRHGPAQSNQVTVPAPT